MATSASVVVGTSAGVLVAASGGSRDVREVHVHAIGALEVGQSGVAVGAGLPLAAGEKRTFTMHGKDVLYAVASGATTARVLTFLRPVS